MGTYKVFDGTNWVDICDCALNVFHPVQGWTDVNPSNCIVKYFDGINWCLIECGGLCTCPDGYVFNPATNLCERVVFQSGTASSSCPLYSIIKRPASSTYNSGGAFLWEDITSKPKPLIGWKHSETGFYRIVDNNGLGTQLNVIGNEVVGNNIFLGNIMGRLNYSGIYTTPTWPDNVWLKTTRCITITEERQYIFAFSADNELLAELKIGSNPYQTIVFLSGVETSQTTPPSPGGSAQASTTVPFQYWHMFPITLPVGTHILRLSARNAGADFTMGAEIYQMTEAEMLTFLATPHTDPTAVAPYPSIGNPSISNDLSPYIIFSTRQLVTTPALQTVTPDCTITYTCPPGTEPNFCYGITACAVVETTPCN